MTPQEQQAFDQMREALEVLNHLDADINFLNTNELEEMVDKALAAAKAVSDEPKVKLIPTAEELGTPVQPQAQGEAVDIAALCARIKAERDQARAELAAIRAQEPVAWMMCGVDKETRLTMNRPSAEHRKLFTCIYPLYTEPKVAQPWTTKELVLMNEQYRHERAHGIGGQQP